MRPDAVWWCCSIPHSTAGHEVTHHLGGLRWQWPHSSPILFPVVLRQSHHKTEMWVPQVSWWHLLPDGSGLSHAFFYVCYTVCGRRWRLGDNLWALGWDSGAAGHADPVGSHREEGLEPAQKASSSPAKSLSHQQLIIRTLCIDLTPGRRPCIPWQRLIVRNRSFYGIRCENE